jgi:hypothetical protein
MIHVSIGPRRPRCRAAAPCESVFRRDAGRLDDAADLPEACTGRPFQDLTGALIKHSGYSGTVIIRPAAPQGDEPAMVEDVVRFGALCSCTPQPGDGPFYTYGGE